MTRARSVAAGLGCVVAAALMLESLRWVRPVLLGMARLDATAVRLDDEGRVLLSREERLPGPAREYEEQWFDAAGNRVETPASSRGFGPPIADRMNRASSPFAAAEARFHWDRSGDRDVASIAAALDDQQGWDDANRSARATAREWLKTHTYPTALCAWEFEAGRFVCRDLRDGSVRAGFGPDGFTDGEAGARGERFDESTTPPVPAWAWRGEGGRVLAVLLEPARRRIHFLQAARPRDPEVLAEPLRVEVVTIPVSGPNGEEPRVATDEHFAWLWWGYQHTSRDLVTIPLRAGSDLLAVRASGVLWRVPLASEERDVIVRGDASHVGTVLAPVGGPVARLRVRRVLADGRVLSADAAALPVTGRARNLANAVGVAAALRPPLLGAVSWAAPPVEDYADYYGRWLRDGVIAGGVGTGWLLLSLAIGAACAYLAATQARLRDPRRVALWTALGLAGGLLVLPWMRLAMPRSHVVACACGRRRAVHVAACPSCAAPWPAPSRTGLEVFA